MGEDIQPNGRKVLFVVAPEEFRDEEYFTPKKILEDNGFEVVTASIDENAKSMFGKSVKVNVSLDDAESLDYDCIVFVGGSGASVYFENEKAQQLAKEFCDDGKLTAAICIGLTDTAGPDAGYWH